jgi:hypothetical protein
MNNSRRLLTLGLLLLTFAGIFVDRPFAGLLLAGGVLCLIGSFNNFLGGLRGS